MKRSLLTGLLAAFLLSGCATLVHGPHQDLTVNSEPAGVTVFLNDEEQGTTPLTLTLERKQRYVLRLEEAGFAPATQRLARRADPWAIVGGLFTGPISLGVDWATGSWYILKPDPVFVRLEPTAPQP